MHVINQYKIDVYMHLLNQHEINVYMHLLNQHEIDVYDCGKPTCNKCVINVEEQYETDVT